jgi:phage baseplate assembly protein W
MRRTYGSLIPDLIDNPQNAVLRMQLMSAIVIALATWETRIVLSEVDVVFPRPPLYLRACPGR